MSDPEKALRASAREPAIGDGYPAVSRFISSDLDGESYVFRKFRTLTARKLLYMQSQILELEEARTQAVTSLRNWTAGNPCIARAETAYLNHNGDLLSVAPTDDTVMAWIAKVIEKFWILLRPVLGLVLLSYKPKVELLLIRHRSKVLVYPVIPKFTLCRNHRLREQLAS